jgi:hypothetical protein
MSHGHEFEEKGSVGVAKKKKKKKKKKGLALGMEGGSNM